jgi:hypothetical protein
LLTAKHCSDECIPTASGVVSTSSEAGITSAVPISSRRDTALSPLLAESLKDYTNMIKKTVIKKVKAL